MVCTCQQAQPFDLIVNGQKKTFYGLDVVVFQTTVNQPQTRAEAERLLWEYALEYNDIPREEEGFYREALYEAYLQMKHVFEKYV